MVGVGMGVRRALRELAVGGNPNQGEDRQLSPMLSRCAPTLTECCLKAQGKFGALAFRNGPSVLQRGWLDAGLYRQCDICGKTFEYLDSAAARCGE